MPQPKQKSYLQSAIKGAASWVAKKVQSKIAELKEDLDSQKNNNTFIDIKEIPKNEKVEVYSFKDNFLLPESIELSTVVVDDGFYRGTTYTHEYPVGSIPLGYMKVLQEMSKYFDKDQLMKLGEYFYDLSFEKNGVYHADLKAAGEFLGMLAIKRKE